MKIGENNRSVHRKVLTCSSIRRPSISSGLAYSTGKYGELRQKCKARWMQSGRCGAIHPRYQAPRRPLPATVDPGRKRPNAHPASSIPHPTSNIQHPAASTDDPMASMQISVGKGATWQPLAGQPLRSNVR